MDEKHDTKLTRRAYGLLSVAVAQPGKHTHELGRAVKVAPATFFLRRAGLLQADLDAPGRMWPTDLGVALVRRAEVDEVKRRVYLAVREYDRRLKRIHIARRKRAQRQGATTT